MNLKDETEVYYLCGGELKVMDESSISWYWVQNIQLKLLRTLSESFMGLLLPPAHRPASAQKTASTGPKAVKTSPIYLWVH